MRKTLLAMLVLLSMAPMALRSQNVITVHLKDAGSIYFAFVAKPVISFTDADVVLTTSDGFSITYPLANLTKFTFDTRDLTQVNAIANDAKAVLSIDEYTVTVSGIKAQEKVKLTALDGKVLNTFKADKDGTLSFSVAELSEGTYIVSSDDFAVKILKQ